jgi:hypothetical protein
VFKFTRAATAALLLCVETLSIGATTPPESFEQRLVEAHNKERASLGLPPLSWSDQLADGAHQWADHLRDTGRFQHSPNQLGGPRLGENIWGGTHASFSPEEMVGAWIAEKKHFTLAVFPMDSSTGRVEDVSHYTQVIWRTSWLVGCALSQGPSEDILVCRYSQAGNIIGSRPI